MRRSLMPPWANHPASARQGFTLIELSMVLLIIGLIVGGIFAGQELYRLSQINSVATDLARLRTGIDAFKLKFRAIPGDMPDATHYFGTASGGCPNGTGTGTQTCDGNGDGYVGNGNAYENFRFWQHLAAAGLIANPSGGYFSGLPGASSYSLSTNGDHRVGVNCPNSRVKKLGYAVFYTPKISFGANHPLLYGGTYNNAMVVGGENPGYETSNGVFTAAEAASLDRKFDDGKPGMGRMVTRNGTVAPNCSTGTTTTSTTATYNTTNTDKACIFYFRQATD